MLKTALRGDTLLWKVFMPNPNSIGAIIASADAVGVRSGFGFGIGFGIGFGFVVVDNDKIDIIELGG